MGLKKGFDKALKIYQLSARICWGLPRSFCKSCWSSKQWPEITGNLYTYLFWILLKNKQKPITNSCRNNLWYKPILILSKTEFKILSKKLGDEMFLLHSNSWGTYETIPADLKRFSNIETHRCYSFKYYNSMPRYSS